MRQWPAVGLDAVGLEETKYAWLGAKPLIDISVGLPPGGSLPAVLADECGLAFRAVNPESVLFAIFGRPGFRLANVHVRFMGAESERWDVLFRDFLRAHPVVAQEYGEAKRGAATVEGSGRSRYSDTKAPFIRSIIPKIEAWASKTDWRLAPPRTSPEWNASGTAGACRMSILVGGRLVPRARQLLAVTGAHGCRIDWRQ